VCDSGLRCFLLEEFGGVLHTRASGSQVCLHADRFAGSPKISENNCDSRRKAGKMWAMHEGVTKASKKDRGGRWVPPKYFSLRCGSLERCSLRQLEHLGADGPLVHSAFVSGCKPTSPSRSPSAPRRGHATKSVGVRRSDTLARRKEAPRSRL
jgi:hypothetical protein